MMIWLFLILIFILVVAATWWFGLWSNFITLINLVLAGLIATSFYENVTALLLKFMETFAVLIEFVGIWLTFVVAFMVLRGATDALSAIRLKFDPLTELIGRSLLSVAIAAVFVCFATFTMQMGPLPPHLFAADYTPVGIAAPAPGSSNEEFEAHAEKQAEEFRNRSENSKYEEAVGPDKLWVSTCRYLSKTSLSTSREKGLFYPTDGREFKTEDGVDDLGGLRVYDPYELFFEKCSFQRSAISRKEVLRIETKSN